MRQLIIEKNPDSKGLVQVTGKDFKYLRQVLRVKAGDMLSLRLLDGSLKNSTVAAIDEKSRKITLQVCADTDVKTITRGVQASQLNNADSSLSIQGIEYWLFQFIPKPVKLEQIVRQATECGIKHIVPVIGEYSEKSSILALDNTKKERIERIIKEARQQSGSPVDTVLHEPLTLDQAIELWMSCGAEGESLAEKAGEQGAGGQTSAALAASVGFVLSERDDGDGDVRSILKKKSEENKIQRICIACGCEGGISPEEVELLLKKGLFYPLHFSVNILRCETAALYGIAAVQTAV
ncbi:MAG: 16S rRNA (uracil(1498)-N(3))-methyltransferase [Treponema sp.]|nr:16S rRNA (uracil(1498)-N(3))-methyltransferase [Treponema sp.]